MAAVEVTVATEMEEMAIMKVEEEVMAAETTEIMAVVEVGH